MKLFNEIKIITRHMFAWKALIYRFGTMGIKTFWTVLFAWMWGHTLGGLLCVAIMIANEFIWYGIVEHTHGTYKCPECGHEF